ncbi:TetR/AcrR family transcriptional regulator [Salinifilum ghardaiensis]
MSTGPAERSDQAGAATDGRLAKGQRRRRGIIDATRRLLAREGVAAVSHRNAAREAGVPPASVAYYFNGIDELLVAALLDCVDDLLAEIERLSRARSREDWPRVVAELLVAMVRDNREQTIAEYELYLLAARRPALRPAARRWIEATAGYLAGDVDEAGERALLWAVDGLLIQALLADEPPAVAEVEPALRRLMRPGAS